MQSQKSQTGRARKASLKRGRPSFLSTFLLSVVLFVLVRTFLVEAFRIPSGSMEKTLMPGDFLFVSKLSYGATIPFTRIRLPGLHEPRRGDIIVFRPPHDPRRFYVKRLIASGGDTVEMRNARLFLNGKAQEEPFVQHIAAGRDAYAASMRWQCAYRPQRAVKRACRPTRDNWGPVVVPAGKYLALGDNRDDSLDSRFWGFVDRSAIRGKPLIVYYSFDNNAPDPLAPLRDIRWARLGRPIR